MELTIPKSDDQIVNFIHNSYDLKPTNLKVEPLLWKFAVRSVVRGDNLLIRGDSGFGKTMLAYTLADVFKRPFFVFNLGSTQDARSTLIGNTHFAKDVGTYVGEALFVKAIQTPNAIILLDEVSRAHPDAHNILMSVLDHSQRYLRIDESPETPTIKVAEGVTFIGTANVGTEYTATRTMDHAFVERWKILIMPHLKKEQEVELLTERYPNLDSYDINAIASIANTTREQVNLDTARIDRVVSTRTTTELAALMVDGFTLPEAAELKLYPFYSSAGGSESPQTYMRQLVQKFIKKESGDKKDNKVDDDVIDLNKLNGGHDSPF